MAGVPKLTVRAGRRVSGAGGGWRCAQRRRAERGIVSRQWRRAPRGVGREAVDPRAGRNGSGMIPHPTGPRPRPSPRPGPPCRSASWPQKLRSTNTICPACWLTRTRTLTVRAPLRLAPLLGRRPSPAGSSRRRRCGGHRRRGPCPRGRQRRPSRPSDQPRRLPSSAPAGLSQGCSLPGHLSPPRSAPCRDCQHHQLIKDRRIGHLPTAHDPSVLEHTTPSEPEGGHGGDGVSFSQHRGRDGPLPSARPWHLRQGRLHAARLVATPMLPARRIAGHRAAGR